MAAVRGINASNYVTAGKAAAQNFITTSGAVLDNSPKYDKFGKQQVVDNYKAKQVAMQADQLVAEEGIKAETRVRKAKIQADKDKSIAKSKMTVRKAGVVAAAGELVADSLKPVREPYKPDWSLMEAEFDRIEGKIDDLEASDPNEGYAPPTRYGDGTGSSSQVGGTGSSSQVTGSVSKGEVFNYLTGDKGLSRNHALGLMANIDRESGFVPTIRSGDDKGPGGLFQWKGSRQTDTVATLVNSGNWKGQIDYALTEPANLSAVTPGAFQSQKFDTPQQAADWWMTNWERPADTKAGSLKHTDFISTYKF